MMSAAEIRQTLFLMQLSDSALPIGSYSHSFGLETWTQMGTLHSPLSVETALRLCLHTAIAPLDGAACALSQQSSLSADGAGWQRINQRLTAMKCPPEALRASLDLGRRLLQLGLQLNWPGAQSLLDQCGGDRQTERHHATVYGWLAAANAIDLPLTTAAFLQSTVAAHVSAAVRLIPLGHTDGQRLISALRNDVIGAAERVCLYELSDMNSFAPLHEWAGVEHEQLESRLFQS